MWTYQIIVTITLLQIFVLVLWNLHAYALPPANPIPPRPEEPLFVLIPARNEAENIEDCLRGLLAQTYPDFRLLVLDDGSDDGTDQIVEAIARQDKRVELLRGQPLGQGWAGKVWACRQLGEAALERGAEWLLFLDADTRARPGFVAAILHHGQTTNAGMVSTFPYQVTGTFWERVALPMLQFLITTFLPVGLIWRLPFPQLVAACGQVELFAAATYRRTGGHGSIPNSFHDGLQLARRTKQAGDTVRLFDGSPLISCRMYAGGKAVWNGFTRNAYEGLGGFVPLVAMTILQTVLFLLPLLCVLVAVGMALLGGGWPGWGWLCVGQCVLILIIRVLQAQRFGHSGSIWLHPLSIGMMVAIQWASFFKTLRKSRVVWKGRAYN